MNMIEVHGVALSYSGHERELEDVNFAVAQGEFVSIIGPSGCGKSTLLRIIAGVLPPLAGEVLLDGRLVRGRTTDIGFVPQDGLLLPWLSARNNVALPLELNGLPGAEARKEADHLLVLVGLPQAACKYPAALSGGERQRVAIARALAGDPSVLLLDEPFASLDAITREELNLVLQEIWIHTGATVLLVTHNILEAIFLSDRILVMREQPGTILEEAAVNLPRPRNLSDLNRLEIVTLAGRVRMLLSGGGRYDAGKTA